MCCANDAVRVLRSFALPLFTSGTIDAKMPVARSMAAKISAQFIAAARKDMGYEALPIVAITSVQDSSVEKSE